MFSKRILCTILIMLTSISLWGCRRSFDKTGYVTALLDACYHGEYSQYSYFTGMATAQLSGLQDEWLEAETDRFLAMFGSLSPSEGTREDIKNMLRMIYASTSYSVEEPQAPDLVDSGEEKYVTVRLEPIMLIKDNYDEIKEYTDAFNKANGEFKYYELSAGGYADEFLEGILTLLKSHLSSIPFDEPKDITISLKKGEDGLFSVSPDDLLLIRDTMFPGTL